MKKKSSQKQPENQLEKEVSWIGTWKNQYGSVLEITSQANGRIEGTFQTTLKESNLYWENPSVVVNENLQI